MLLDLLSSYQKLASYDFEKLNSDDFVDKLSRKFSAIMMICFTTILGVANLVGKPLECWCHNEYSGSRCNYAKTFCYITNFFVPVGNTSHLPAREELETHRILYYQWVPYIFLFQAFLFYAPSLLWSVLNTKSGFDLKNYVRELKKDSKKDPARYVVTHMKECSNFRISYQGRGALKKALSINPFNNGIYLSICYLSIKFLYAMVALLQIFILNYWFRDDYYSQLSFLSFYFGPHNWRFTERFPRMTLCKFQVYILNDQQTHWMQCTLPINIYIEKMYYIIGIWCIILFVITMVSFFRYIIFLVTSRNRYVQNLLIKTENDEMPENHLENLRPDDLLCLELIKVNTSEYDLINVVRKLNKID